MIKVRSETDRIVVAKIEEHGQGHLFETWDTFSTEEQKALLAQLRGIDLPRVTRLIELYRQGAQRKLQEKVRRPSRFVEIPRTDEARQRWKESREIGDRALREGKVAVLMAAGGTGSRLGFPGPKGTFSIGPVSGKSLYCLHSEKIRALGRRYRVSIPLFLVTSPQTHDSTVAAYRESDYFGLARQDVKFLEQDAFPVIDRRGRFFFTEAGQIAMRPNGHGGALLKVLEDDAFQALERRGVEHVYYFQVDNPLVRVADPTFVGQHVSGSHEITSKAVQKTDPAEKIGIFCQCNGATTVVEYSELSAEDQARRGSDGKLVYSTGNVAIHLFSVDFLRRIREENLTLPYHFIEKKTPYLDRRGRKIFPDKPNSVAFESFIFDAMQWTRSSLIVETSRDEEFSPIKNARGTDSPESARRSLCRLYNRWLRDAGATIPAGTRDDNGNGESELDFPVEISPLFALSSEELQKKIQLPLELTPNFYLE